MIRMVFVGDTLLGGEAQPLLDRHGPDYALEGLLPFFDGADLVIINHEGPLTARRQPMEKADTGRKRYWYRGEPESALALARAGVRVASLGNNHVLDFGPDGIADTVTALNAAGIASCGAGRDVTMARRPVMVERGGYRIAFVSCMQRYDLYIREHAYAAGHRAGPYRLRMARLRDDLAKMRGAADFLVVLAHWGRNYRPVSALQERLALELRQAGADIVIGHHPHIPQRVDLTGGRPVLFSLGNGALGTPGRFHSGRPPFGLVATIEIDPSSQTLAVDLRLLEVDNAKVGFRPIPADPAGSRDVLHSLVSSDSSWRRHHASLRTELALREVR